MSNLVSNLSCGSWGKIREPSGQTAASASQRAQAGLWPLHCGCGSGFTVGCYANAQGPTVPP